MQNILDYVIWRGDVTFEEQPFQMLDNLIFSQLIYMDMTEAFSDVRRLTLQEVWKKEQKKPRFCSLTQSTEDVELWEACAQSKRYKDVVLSDYVDQLELDLDKQFASVTYHINEQDTVIAFRGTDNSIVGWKEDFMLSYTEVPAQKQALEYCHEIMKDPGNYYIIGHSKGANLALYSAAHLSDTELQNVRKIYLNDGPGFCKDVLDVNLIQKIDEKCVRITPEYCIVGAIFEPSITESYIVKSSAQQLLQHSLLSWGVTPKGLDTVASHDTISERINGLFDVFIEKMESLEDRQTFVNSIFDTMAAHGAVTVDEFMKEGPQAFENLIMTVVSDDPDGANPLRSVKENVKRDMKQSRIGRFFAEKSQRVQVLRVFGSILIGVLCFMIPESLIKSCFAIGIFFLIALELYQTFHYLRLSKWDFNKEKTRVNICIVLLVAYVLMIVKDDALYLFSSIVLGVFFWICCYQFVIKFKEAKGNRLRRRRFLLEAIMTFVFGGYILIAPEVGIGAYTMSVGSFFLIDAICEVIHMWKSIKSIA